MIGPVISRRALMAGAAASGAGLTRRACAQAHPSQSYPNRVIKMIVPFAPGGPADTMARLAAQQLSTRLGQSVIIDNRARAGGSIATKAVAGAEPDGYTLLFGNTATFAVAPAVYVNIGYDPVKQFAPIALFSVSTNLLVADPKLPVQSVPELIAHAKANPGKINFASLGYGTPPHMIGEMFKQRAGLDIVHVPYKGTAAALTDIMAGQVQLTFENPSVLVQLIGEGRLRGLATTGETRNPQAPELPTMIESGLPDFVSTSFTALAAPAGTAPDIVRRLNAEINAGLNSSELASTFAKLGVGARPMSPAEFGAFLVRENQKWSAVAQRAGVRIE
jgi:tripartite-type tricarboxylate transporter receptor subunit TctC